MRRVYGLVTGAQRPAGVAVRPWRALHDGDCSTAALGRTLQADEPAAALLWRLQTAGLLAEGWAAQGRRPVLWREPRVALLPARGPCPGGVPLQAAAELLWQREASPLASPVWAHAPGAGWRLRGSLLEAWPRWMGLPAATSRVWAQRLARAGLPGREALEWLWQARVVVSAADAGPQDDEALWPLHARLLHTASRRGLGRLPGRQVQAPALPASPVPTGGPAVPWPALEPGDTQALAAWQALVAQRRSQRRHAAQPLPLPRLVAWLDAVFGTVQGRKAYGSGGALYALRPFIVVNAVAGLAAGAWQIDAHARTLVPLAGDAAACTGLLHDAAASGGVDTLPAVLVVLAADLPRVQAAYGDLAHSLLLKEAGAVFEAAQLAAGALDLACCPMGTGEAVAFEAASGLSRARWPALAELTLGLPAR